MEEREQKSLRLKMLDYQRFSFIFMFLGAFLYIGTIIPFAGKTEMKTNMLTFASLAIIIVSLLFYWRMRKAKDELNKI